MRRPPPRLIAELITLTTADGRSVAELARELEVDETTLMQYRSGRRPISMKSYARIVRRFAEHRLIRDLAVHYAAVEYHVEEMPTKLAPIAPAILPRAVEQSLTQYAEAFAAESVRGARGLYLIGIDRALSAAAQFVVQLFDSAKVSMCRLQANKKPGASESRHALAAPLLVVERIDFLCEEVASLICRRADLVRPTIVTSTQEPENIADPYLRRILALTMRRVPISQSSAPASSSPQQHAAT